MNKYKVIINGKSLIFTAKSILNAIKLAINYYSGVEIADHIETFTHICASKIRKKTKKK